MRLALVALLAEGHVLMEDVPGTGKTSLARSLSASLGLTGSLYAIVGMGALVLAYLLLQVRVPMLERLKAVIPMGPFLALALVAVSIVLP